MRCKIIMEVKNTNKKYRHKKESTKQLFKNGFHIFITRTVTEFTIY